MIVVAGCATSKKTTVTDPALADFKYGQTKFEGYTRAMFDNGKTIVNKSCNGCHGFKDPKGLTEERINHVIPNMAKKAKITDEEKDLVLKYYIASGKHG